MGLLDRTIKSGDIIRIVKDDSKDHFYNIVYTHGCLQVEFSDLSKLFIKAFGKTIYCNSIYVEGEDHQVYKLSEDEFRRLVSNKEFIVYVDDHVYTLKNYPDTEASEFIRDMLNNDIYDPNLTMDNRFIHSQCFQFEEIKSKINH